MNERGEPRLAIRTAVAADLPELQEVYRAASLSNAGDAPVLLARPEFLVFTGDGIAAGRTLVAVAGASGNDRVVGFATVASGRTTVPSWRISSSIRPGAAVASPDNPLCRRGSHRVRGC